MSWARWGPGASPHLPSFMSFGLHMACSDTQCHCEEKCHVLPDLNPFNPQLHETIVPGTFDTCTSALEANGFHEIDHDNLHCINPPGSLIPSSSAVPTNTLTPFVFNIETPSR